MPNGYFGDSRPANVGGQNVFQMREDHKCSTKLFVATTETSKVRQDKITIMVFCKYNFAEQWDPASNGHFTGPAVGLALETFTPDVTIIALEQNIVRAMLHELGHCEAFLEPAEILGIHMLIFFSLNRERS